MQASFPSSSHPVIRGAFFLTAAGMLTRVMGFFYRIFLSRSIGAEQVPEIATGAGHHSVIRIPGRDEYYIVYHRRPLGATAMGHRQTCIDRMEFDADGFIKPVKMTFEGVKPVRIK